MSPSTSSHSPSHPDPQRVQTTSHPLPPPRKTRTVRRRGRGRDDFASDEEFVREAATDSESDDDDRSSIDSSTDSDTEPVSEDILSATHSRILTPNTTQSSADVPSLNGSASKPTKGGLDARRAPFFGDTGNWSEMVAEETAHGPAELPVIEFADLTGPSIDQRSKPTSQRKSAKPLKRPPVKRAVSAPTVDRPAVHAASVSDQIEDSHPEPVSDQPIASTSRHSSRSGFRRPPGQSARQAYQQRLETDPSYVPTVGEFWGHDDRLLDKDLRSLSEWWRGRWQSRGRGRGSFGRVFIRGRGRGAGPGPALPGTQSEDGLATQENSPSDVPRVDQPWTHDGFEEMKKRDEKRREVAQQQPAARPTRGFSPLRGRGRFVAGRGRGGAARGGGVIPHPSTSTASVTTLSVPGKIWYAMKPEYPWTKHLETSLFHDTGPKLRPGMSPSYRVKLPNVEAQIVRGSAQAAGRPKPHLSQELHGSEDGDKTFVVRLPKRTAKDKAASLTSASTPSAKEPHLEDVFTVRPELVPPRAQIVDIKLPSTSVTAEACDGVSTAGPSTQPPQPLATLPSPAPLPAEVQPAQANSGPVDGVLHGHQDTGAPTLLKADTPHAPDPLEIPPGRRTLPPAPPPLQTVFTPPQSSPPYSSPYGYGSPLPPGIAISQHGMAYEVATGRPVYLSAAPVYTPRPLAHGMMTPPGVSYMPGHMHHHSTGSPDFLSAPHTPPINGFIDPATGSPIFAFPRQSSRIEIRAPSSQLDPKSTKSQRRPSNLRTSAAAAEPSGPSSPVNEALALRAEQYLLHDASEVHGDASATSEQQVDPAMYNYAAYQHAYYYPEQYGYSQYYDMSHMPRYEMYQTDPHASQAVYY